MISIDQIRTYYKNSRSLEALNNRRKDMKLKPLDKLGGFTYQEMQEHNMLPERHFGFFHDGFEYRYYEQGKRAYI